MPKEVKNIPYEKSLDQPTIEPTTLNKAMPNTHAFAAVAMEALTLIYSECEILHANLN